MTDPTSPDAARSLPIEWHMSAALENVPRGDVELAEVTSLEGAVRTWCDLDPAHQAHAKLSTERPLQFRGVATAVFTGTAIEELAKLLPR